MGLLENNSNEEAQNTEGYRDNEKNTAGSCAGKIVTIIMGVLILSAVVIVLCLKLTKYPVDLRYSKEYTTGEGNIKGNVDISSFEDRNKDYAIGANTYGYAVFKNPQKAWNTMVKENAEGINLIKNEFGLSELSMSNYRKYLTYGWQCTGGTTEEKEQAKFVSSFLDIYENSFDRGEYNNGFRKLIFD